MPLPNFTENPKTHMNAAVATLEQEHIQQTIAALEKRGVKVHAVETGAEALDRVNQLIPAGASVMTGASKTLQQIGFEDLLKAGKHPWVNLKDDVLAEKDLAKQAHLRRQSTMADYFLGSV